MIAYDRPVPSTPADYYVSFDNEGIGKAIAMSLMQHLKEKGVPTGTGGVLQINGSPTDAAAGLIKRGIHAGIQRSGYKTLAEFDTPEWAPAKAQQLAVQLILAGDQYNTDSKPSEIVAAAAARAALPATVSPTCLQRCLACRTSAVATTRRRPVSRPFTTRDITRSTGCRAW